MATKKTDDTSKTVKVSLPAGMIPVKDIETAAGLLARDDIPADIPTPRCAYEVLGMEKEGDNRVFEVKVSWGSDVITAAVPADGDHDERVKTALTAKSDTA